MIAGADLGGASALLIRRPWGILTLAEKQAVNAGFTASVPDFPQK